MFGAIAFSVLMLASRGDFLVEDVAGPAVPLEHARIVMTGEMQQDTSYQGRNLRLSAIPNADGTWSGAAQFTDEPGRIVKTDTSFASQSEALSAALSQAMATVDRDRMFRGKP
jgi:hypothetical protein